jgi:hypothetical protein
MAKRSADYAAVDPDASVAMAEFNKAVRSIVINVARDCAAVVAERTIAA